MWYKNKLMLLPTTIGIIVIGWGLKSVILPTNTPTSIPPVTQPTQVDENRATVAAIADRVTVRVVTDAAYGSGVIVAQQGQTYTVLTCQHVVGESKQSKYQILVADGKSFPARVKPFPNAQKLDLALLEFDSQAQYSVVTIGKLTELSAGVPVYAAGFPNYYLVGKDNMEETYKLGRKIFKLTTGTVGLILQNPTLTDGYGLGYTNEVELGMSGGPVLNARGELVGINGRSKYPLQGIDAFIFVDGSKPSVENFEKMEPLSWAVPISANLW
jgi:serine protease Do